MNRVILVGRITKDPEVRYTSSDVAVCQFTLAVNRKYQSAGGERQADFISCVAWRNSAELLGKYVKKGAQIGVEGQIQVRNYEDNGGVKRYVTEVICDSITFLESKGSREGGSYSGYSDIEQYNIPQQRKSQSQDSFNPFGDFNTPQRKPQTQDSEDPFKDISNNYDLSNDDLPF